MRRRQRLVSIRLQPCRCEKDATTKMAPHESAVMVASGAGATVTEACHDPLDRRGTPRTCYLVADKFGFQIAERLHRQRSAIRRKAERLRQEGLLPHNPEHFDVNPPKRRPRAEIMQ